MINVIPICSQNRLKKQEKIQNNSIIVQKLYLPFHDAQLSHICTIYTFVFHIKNKITIRSISMDTRGPVPFLESSALPPSCTRQHRDLIFLNFLFFCKNFCNLTDHPLSYISIEKKIMYESVTGRARESRKK
jgi:hypothetical protein